MHRKLFIHIIDKRFDALDANWQGMHQLEVEPIHDWRVAYKKLRAMIRLGEQATKKLKMTLSLKQAYDVSGEVRDRQVQYERMREWFGSEQFYPPAYTHILQSEISGFGDELKSLTENDAILRIAHYKIKTTWPSHLSRHKITSYMQYLLYEIRNILWLTYKKDDYLHSCRKHIKDLQYIGESIGADHLAALQLTGLPAEAELQSGAQQLGKFNDQCMAIAFLSTSYLNRLPAEEKIILSTLKSKLQREKNKMKNEMIQMLEQSFKSIL